MRQVPAEAHYLLIGDGRLARHLAHYLELEHLSFDQWSRRSSVALESLAERCTHVLVAISDSAIEPFLREHSFLRDRVCVHFSGALVSTLASSVHPLMTFGPSLYSLEEYRAVPFVLERDRPVLLPGLSNVCVELSAELKPLYHALCTASGNFTVMLWEAVFERFQSMGLPRQILFPYLVRTAQNLLTAAPGESVLTGPLKRGDFKTIEKHLEALDGDPLAELYRAFVETSLSRTSPTPFPLGGLV
jgi:predicted short-subunit dehydrogenase-like oxidoreductase (DUF2520 family)